MRTIRMILRIITIIFQFPPHYKEIRIGKFTPFRHFVFQTSYLQESRSPTGFEYGLPLSFVKKTRGIIILRSAKTGGIKYYFCLHPNVKFLKFRDWMHTNQEYCIRKDGIRYY
jgi:uncharacterized protein YecE (DUF72 family)